MLGWVKLTASGLIPAEPDLPNDTVLSNKGIVKAGKTTIFTLKNDGSIEIQGPQ